MPTPTIPAGNKQFNATTYNGTASTSQYISGVGFQPDFVWMKSRSNAYNHYLTSSYDFGESLVSNSTGAVTGNVLNFADGYVGADGFYPTWYQVGGGSGASSAGQTFVGWSWKASNAAGVTNTQGTITSTVSANTTAGFSIVTYTGNTINGATVGHGLLVGGVTTAPSMIIVKNRSTSTLWSVYHASVGAASVAHLNDTAAFSASGDWNSVTPTPTLFTIGTSNRVNNADNYVAYCWAPVAGYSAFGSYTGNSSTDGPFIYTGFRPRFILFKNITQASQWILLDSARNTYNVVNTYLETNTADSDNTSTNILDMLSNGFKLRDSGGTDFNENANNYIYMAFAENPFKYANAR